MSNFKVWIDTPITSGETQNVYDANTFIQGVASERAEGFKAGTYIKSLSANSGIRQANLVAVALMETIGAYADGLSLTSTVDDVKNALTSYFTNGNNVKVQFSSSESRTNISSNESLSTMFGKISKYLNDLKALAFKSSLTNADVSSLSVYNVTTQINGKNIAMIFESNGTTVKRATNSTNAENAQTLQGQDFSAMNVNYFGDYFVTKKLPLYSGAYQLYVNGGNALIDVDPSQFDKVGYYEFEFYTRNMYSQGYANSYHRVIIPKVDTSNHLYFTIQLPYYNNNTGSGLYTAVIEVEHYTVVAPGNPEEIMVMVKEGSLMYHKTDKSTNYQTLSGNSGIYLSKINRIIEG